MTRPRTAELRSSCCADAVRKGPPVRWEASILALVLVALAPCGCEDAVSTIDIVDRDHRFGIFRDLVLFNRPLSEGGPFFLDRFEATRADFVAWRASLPQRSGPLPVPDRLRDHLPQDRINLNVARRFARWRFCRVPRADEWRYAFTEGGTYDFPWSDTLRNSDTLANTGRLGLGRTTLVGSFASGSASPIGPFDLLGNVAEWTETVVDADTNVPIPFVHQVLATVLVKQVVGLPEWPDFQTPEIGHMPWQQSGAMPLGLRVWLPLWTPMPGAWLDSRALRAVQGQFDFTEEHFEERPIVTLDMPGVDAFRRTPGLGCWLPGWSPVPTDWLVFAETNDLERQVLGGHFETKWFETLNDPVRRTDPSALYWSPGRSDPTTGVRVAADPAGLLQSLLEYAGPMPSEAALNTLRGFLRRESHVELFLRAWPFVLPRAKGTSALRSLLISELGNE